MPKHYEIEELVDSLATISDIIFKRLHCMECNQCEPCGAVFMKALNNLRQAGHIEATAKEHLSGAGTQNR
ncbi:MAG: hypothetical protein QOE88_27 [Verrucomicrobiota bacterium]|jgi:hypothetical protein|nr:hypothetical protein [Verrucomicrobiota bacterium]MEA3162209.1 hypothetical protein [Verrucomicrobiota bacterium]